MKSLLHTCALLLLLSGLGVAIAAEPAAKKPAAAAAKSSKKTAKAKEPPLPTLLWRGDHNTARAFMRDMAADFEKSKQGKVTLQPFSTISGLDAVHDGSADIAGSSRPPMLERAEENGTNFYPVAWDALVMITSPKNPVGNITLKQIHDIYLGHIKDWSELGGPPGEINLYGIAPPLDGSEYSLRDLIFHHGDQAVAKTVEIVQADHQNKTDVGANTVRQWFDQREVDAVVDANNSAVGLAVAGVALSLSTSFALAKARLDPLIPPMVPGSQ